MSDPKQKDQSVLVLKNVRLSFPFIFTPRKQQGDNGEEGNERYSASFIIKKTDPQAEQVRKAIKKAVASFDKWKGKTVKVKGTNEVLTQGTDGTVVLAGICLRDGAELEDKDGYGEDVVFVAAARPKTDSKGGLMPAPSVVGRDKAPVKGDSKGAPYGGCYVNASIRLWCMDNKFGKRVCADLRAVMFEKDGEPFGSAPVDAAKEFAGLGEEGEFDDEPAPAKKKAATNVDDI